MCPLIFECIGSVCEEYQGWAEPGWPWLILPDNSLRSGHYISVSRPLPSPETTAWLLCCREEETTLTSRTLHCVFPLPTLHPLSSPLISFLTLCLISQSSLGLRWHVLPLVLAQCCGARKSCFHRVLWIGFCVPTSSRWLIFALSAWCSVMWLSVHACYFYHLLHWSLTSLCPAGRRGPEIAGLVCPFILSSISSRQHLLKSVGWTAMQFCDYIHDPQRMNPVSSKTCVLMTPPLVPPMGQYVKCHI